MLLDVNVPMYAAGRDHPLREACVWVMRQIAEGSLDVVIDAEIVQEVLYRFGALKRADVAVALARSLLALVPGVLPVTAWDVRMATDVYERYAPVGLSARDALHVAVMQNAGIDLIISTDTHFDRVEGIQRVDPVALARGAR